MQICRWPGNVIVFVGMVEEDFEMIVGMEF